MLGSGALGEFALGEGPLQSRLLFGNQWQTSVKKVWLSAAVITTTVVGFVPPPARSATVFSSFSQPQPQRRMPPVEQRVILFGFAPAAVPLGGGTSRKLDFSEPVTEAPRRNKKTGLVPVKKVATQPLIEPRKPALPLPPFTSAQPAPLDQRSPLDVVDRELIPHGLQAQILAAQAAYLDEQDARDVADVMAILDGLDGDEA